MTFMSIQDLYEIYEQSGYYVDMEDTKRNQCICYRKECD